MSVTTGWGSETVEVRLLTALTLAAFLVASSRAESNSVSFEDANQELPLSVAVDGVELRLFSTAILRVGLVFKVYGAALYLPEDRRVERVLDSDVARRLVVYYLHDTPRERMIDTAEATLRKNLSEAAYKSIEERLKILHAAVSDRKSGDRSSLTYLPGRGLRFAVNDVVQCTIEGADFAAAYFGVWLGEQPSSRRVKRQLFTSWRGEDSASSLE